MATRQYSHRKSQIPSSLAEFFNPARASRLGGADRLLCARLAPARDSGRAARAPPRDENRYRVRRAQATHTFVVMSARLLVAVALVACTASAIKHKLETQQKKPAMTREDDLVLIDRAAINQIGKSKLVYHLILAGCSGAPGPHC